jgi:hypothetical protein
MFGAFIGPSPARAGLLGRRRLHLKVYPIWEQFAIYNGLPGRVAPLTSEEGSNGWQRTKIWLIRRFR